VSGWRTAVRIAAREARRAKGRAVLVLVMLMLPVMALTFAAVTYDSFHLTSAESYARTYGQFDADLQWPMNAPVRQDAMADNWDSLSGQFNDSFKPTEADLLKQLPAGTTAIPAATSQTLGLRTKTGVGDISVRGLDLRNPGFAGVAKLLRGTAPATDAEVALNAAAAARIGVDVGGTVSDADGERHFKVTGIVEVPGNLGATMVMLPQPGTAAVDWLVDTPGPVTWTMVKQLNQHGILVKSRAVALNPPPKSQIDFDAAENNNDAQAYAIAGLVFGLGVLEVVLLAGPAFAVGARRRQRDLALVAANGGTPAHLRRIVLADGLVLGAVAAVLGLALGIAAGFALRGVFETNVVERAAGGYRVFPLALVAIVGAAVATGLLAAAIPAFAAARQNIITSLTGRRGVTRSRKRWIVLGLAMMSGGAAVVIYSIVNVATTLLTVGLVVAELGLVLCTPALVGLIARVGRLLPLAPRIALRDTSRNRSSAAPAISAVMAAVVGSVAIGIFVVGSSQQLAQMYKPTIPLGYAEVYQAPETPTGKQVPPADLEQAARRTLPVKQIVPLSTSACPAGTDDTTYCSASVVKPPANRCPAEDLNTGPTKAQIAQFRKDPRCDHESGSFSTSPFQVIVDDGTDLGLLTGATGDELARAQATLRAGGVLVDDPYLLLDGKATVSAEITEQTSDHTASVQRPPNRQVPVPGYMLHGVATGATIISPAAVKAVGLGVKPLGIVAATTRTPTQAEQDALEAAVRRLPGGYSSSIEHGPKNDDALTMLILQIAAGVIALGAAAIATGLAAVESRGDLATLAAVGASPGLRRRLSLSQSGVIAGLGSLLGGLVGVGTGVAILWALNYAARQAWPPNWEYPIHLPWSNLLVGVVIVPLVAMLGAGLLTRSRLPIERRL
jgi:putative ABC transport system permease protein